MQHLFVVETNKKNQSDSNYLLGIVRYYYDVLGQKLNFVYMNSKTRYNKVTKDIDKKINAYLPNKTIVYLCVDLDKNNIENDILNKTIFNYAKKKNYEFIWFYEDIESSVLGHKVNDKDKKKESEKFLNKKLYKEIDISNLNIAKYNNQMNTSNLFIVLDKYLKRKLF